MARFTDFKPEDMVRCFRCKKLAQKSLSVTIAGQTYGSDCAALAFQTAAAPFTCQRCGHHRTAEEMADAYYCLKCTDSMTIDQET